KSGIEAVIEMSAHLGMTTVGEVGGAAGSEGSASVGLAAVGLVAGCSAAGGPCGLGSVSPVFTSVVFFLSTAAVAACMFGFLFSWMAVCIWHILSSANSTCKR